MRTLPDHLRLTFMLPGWISGFIKPGYLKPCLHRCTLLVDPTGLVEVQAPNREVMFDQVQRFLRPHVKKRPPFSIAANLETPAQRRPGEPGFARGGSDGWQIIIVGAAIAFSPTSMPPAFVAETPAAIEAR